MSNINNIPLGWEKTTLGEVAKVQTGPFGSQLKNEQYITGGTPVITVEHIKDFRILNFQYPSVTEEDKERLNKYLLKEGDIVFTRVGSVDLSAYVDKSQEGWMFSSRMLCVRTNENIDSKFLSYFFRQNIFRRYIYKISVGATMPSINTGILKSIPISYPSLLEQKSIAAILTSFDDKIDNIQTQNETLESTAQTIFTEWFGKYQLANELPESWRIAKLSEFIADSIGGDYGKESLQGDYIVETLCLRGTDLPDMKTGVPERAPKRFLKKSKIEKCNLISGDIVIEISGGTENQSTGRVAYINDQILKTSKLPITCVNFCRILRPIDPDNSYFIYSFLEYLYNRRVLFNWENGTTGIKNLNLRDLLAVFDISLPQSDKKIVEFNTIAKSLFTKIQTNNSQIDSLKITRDFLLSKLLSGGLRIDEFKDAKS